MADGSIKISIEVDGKQIEIASKELDKLDSAAQSSGKGISEAERSMDSLSDKSADAGRSVKDTSRAIDGLGDSSSQTGKDLKVTDTAIDGLADSGADASKSMQGMSDSLDQASAEASAATEDLNKVKTETEGVGDESTKASGNVKKFVTALGLVAVAAAAFKVLRDSMDAAISRFDTLNTFPKVLEELGVSAEDSQKAMSDLSDGIDGLPTKLDEIASTAQRMFTSFNDMDKATDSAIALNNALLGSGSGADEARRGTEQYLKALQTGKMEMDTWNTLSETMDVALVKLAEEFGYTGRSAKMDLYQSLKDGHVTMDQFNDKLIEIGTGTGTMAKLAKENSLGLATSIQNLRTAVARGVTGIIERIDKMSKAVTGRNIAENIDGMKDVVSASFAVIGNVIDGTTPVVIFFADTVKASIPVVQALTPAVIGLMTAYGAYVVITKASTAISASNRVLATAVASQKTLTLVKNIDTAATVKNTGALTLNNVIIGVLTGRMKLSTAAMIAKAAAANILGGALRFLSGPVGWVTTGIGALVTATVAVVKWFKRSTEESKRLNAETENLSDSTDSLTDNINSNSEAYEQQVKDTKATAAGNEQLARTVENLANKENKSAADKQLLAQSIEQLNGSVEGLNVSYDEEANALNMSSVELQARLDLMKETEAGMAAQERLTEIIQEQNEAQLQLNEINELRQVWNEKLEEGSVKSGEYKDAVAELDEQEQGLKETMFDLGEQYTATEQQMIIAANNSAEAIEEGNLRQITSYEELDDIHKEVFDNMMETYDTLQEAATDAFDKIETKTDHTMQSMTETLEHNQKVVEEWGENQAKLMEWAGENGYDNFIPYIENMGIDSAAELAVLAKASDTELTKFADAIESGATTAGDGLKTALGGELDEAVDLIEEFGKQGPKTLKEQLEMSKLDEIGKMLPQGLAEGMESGVEEAKDAARKMAEDTTAATREAFQTKSPSKVYDEIGGDLTDGLVLGIVNGIPQTIRAVNNMFKGVRVQSIQGFKAIINDYTRQTNTLKNMMVSQFGSIGTNAMGGLNAGLNAGSRRVMATARTIANNVNTTMKRALDIRSPSRKARDEVGKEYVAGIGLGIIDNAKVAYDAIGKLSTGMLKVSSPETAIGASSLGYAGTMNQVTNVYNNNSVASTNAGSDVKIVSGDVFLEGRQVGSVIWRDVKENIDRDNNEINSFKEGR